MAMVRKQFYITSEQDAKVKEIARTLGVTEAEVIRRAIMQIVEEPSYEYKSRSEATNHQVRDVAQMERSLSYELTWSRADLYRDQVRHLDDSAWQEELAFIEERMRSMTEGGSTDRWRREDSYDNRRTRLPD
jgi:hypothetical protein